MTSPEPSSDKNNFKSLVIKGLVSAAALAGTTAIPLLVQRSLQTPLSSNSTPTPIVATPSPITSTPPAQVSSPTASPQMLAPATSQQKLEQDNSDKKPKKKS